MDINEITPLPQHIGKVEIHCAKRGPFCSKAGGQADKTKKILFGQLQLPACLRPTKPAVQHELSLLHTKLQWRGEWQIPSNLVA